MEFQKSLFGRKGRVWLRIGHVVHRGDDRIREEEYREIEHAQRGRPYRLVTNQGRTYWWFQDRFYWENDQLAEDEVFALLVTRQQREQQRIDRAMSMVAMGEEPRVNKRGHTSDDVKQLVWRRDQGRCRVCGSTSELQFDHIIPVAMGGSSEPENLQLLCGPCNRRKGGGLTLR
ncbi:HNH endonuclease [Streptomyces sp. A-14]|uniref:HNH endonuclease n=1 Tax=Streptomyces sp. A-14 TaxID=3127467 RepID=UPI003EBBFCAD